MRSQRGITMASLALYCMVMVMVIGIVATIQANTNKKIAGIEEITTQIPQVNKISMYMLQETKDESNAIKTIAADGSYIQFTNGNTYVHSGEELYKIEALNGNKVKVCDSLKEFAFIYDISNGKEIIKVQLKIGDENLSSKTMTYVFV